MSILKKKDESSVTAMHYEGIPGFQQDFPCQLSVQEDVLVFNQNGSIVKLPISKINGSEWLMETQYMGKYHNNPVSTAKTKTAMKRILLIKSLTFCIRNHPLICSRCSSCSRCFLILKYFEKNLFIFIYSMKNN